MTRDEMQNLCGLGIAAECESAGVEPRYLGGNGMCGDHRLTLWDVNGSRVIGTNGDPVWEDATDADDFAAMLAQINISATAS